MHYVVPDHISEPLYVITPIFNAPRFKSRWKHYHRFAKHMKDSGAILVTIEAAFGEREWAIPVEDECSTHHHHGAHGRDHIGIRVRTSHELWTKENLINVAMSRLPADAKYIAWVDADVLFNRPNWVGETIHQLQHFKFVQMFSEAQDLDPDYKPIGKIRRSFVQTINEGLFVPGDPTYYGGRGASGLAWAARREALDEVGRLMDFCILGAADWHMAHALFGLADKSYPKEVSREYKEKILWWQELAERHIRHNVGQVTGLLSHMWHGKKADRKYTSRWKVLTENDYRPSIDLKADIQGVFQLEDHGDERSIKLRDDIRNYFRERNEDSIDV